MKATITRTSGFQRSWRTSSPGEGALEPEREVVGEDFAEEAGRPPPKVPALVPQDAEVLDEAAERRLDPPPRAHRLPDQPRRTVVLHVCPQRRRQIDTTSGQLVGQVGGDQPLVSEEETGQGGDRGARLPALVDVARPEPPPEDLPGRVHQHPGLEP